MIENTNFIRGVKFLNWKGFLVEAFCLKTIEL